MMLLALWYKLGCTRREGAVRSAYLILVLMILVKHDLARFMAESAVCTVEASSGYMFCAHNSH